MEVCFMSDIIPSLLGTLRLDGLLVDYPAVGHSDQGSTRLTDISSMANSYLQLGRKTYWFCILWMQHT